MIIFELDDFLDDHKSLEMRKLPFRVRLNKDVPVIEKMREKDLKMDLASTEVVLDFLLKHVKYIDIASLPEEQFLKLLEWALLAERRVDQCFVKGSELQVKPLEAKLLSILLGAKIPPLELMEERYKPLIKMIKQNNLAWRCFFLRVQFEFSQQDGIAIPVEMEDGASTQIPFLQCEREKVYDNRSQNIVNHFIFNDSFLFETDCEYRLLGNFSFLKKGITVYNQEKWYDIVPATRVPTYTDTHKLELWIGKKNDVIFLLKRADGFIYSISKREPVHRTLWDYLFYFSRKEGNASLVAPPEEIFLPKKFGDYRKVELRLSDEECDRFFTGVKAAKKGGAKVVSPLSNNSVSFAAFILSHIYGRPIVVKEHLFQYFTRKWLPKEFFQSWKRTFSFLFDKKSGKMKKGWYFFPISYLATVFSGLVIYLSTLPGIRMGTDLSLINLFFRPWLLTADSAFILHKTIEDRDESD